MEKKTKAIRRPLPKDHRIHLRLTKEMIRRGKKAAKLDECKSLSEWIRGLIVVRAKYHMVK